MRRRLHGIMNINQEITCLMNSEVLNYQMAPRLNRMNLRKLRRDFGLDYFLNMSVSLTNKLRCGFFYVCKSISSQTGEPICMKLWGCIQFDPGYCMGYFSTSGRNLKTGSWLFFGNRKLKTSEPEVEKYPIRKLVGFGNESPIFVFWYLNPGNHQNHFCPGMSIY